MRDIHVFLVRSCSATIEQPYNVVTKRQLKGQRVSRETPRIMTELLCYDLTNILVCVVIHIQSQTTERCRQSRSHTSMEVHRSTAPMTFDRKTLVGDRERKDRLLSQAHSLTENRHGNRIVCPSAFFEEYMISLLAPCSGSLPWNLLTVAISERHRRNKQQHPLMQNRLSNSLPYYHIDTVQGESLV